MEQGNKEFTQYGVLILKNGQIYVPNLEDIQYKMICSYHNHKLRGHSGVRKMRELIMCNVLWKGITQDIKDYVKACPVC